MIREQIRTKYPNLASALLELQKTEQTNNASDNHDQIFKEISLALASADSEVLAEGLFPAEPTVGEVYAFGIRCYQKLGANDDVRRFVGLLWSHAMLRWDGGQRKQFLEVTVSDPHQVFFALDFTSEMLRKVELTAAEALPWIVKAHAAVSTDSMQRGFWLSLEAICERTPAEAISVVEMWMALSPDESARNAIARIVGYVRRYASDNRLAGEAFRDLEHQLQNGHPSWRAIWIRSWAENVLSVDEQKVLQIRNSSTRDQSEERSGFIYLLCAISRDNHQSWPWIIRELRDVTSDDLEPESKYWISGTALSAIERSEGDYLSQWQQIFNGIMPISAELDGVWRMIEHHLVDEAEKNPEVLRSLVKNLADRSGKTFFAQLKGRKLSYLVSVLTQKGIHRLVCTDLCFGSTVTARKLGLLLFAECGVDHLEGAVVEQATQKQVSLLLLEAQRTPIDHAALGRLHACLAMRVDVLGGELLYVLYDEVALQALNTYAYREAVKREASSHEYMKVILDDVDRRLNETQNAGRSAALQMDVPHRSAAELLNSQKVARDVAKGVKEHSVFLNLIRRVTLLYGGHSWRTFMPNGTLGESSKMHTSSATVEIPRLEFIDLEGMHIRRLQASMAIAKLEATEAEK